MSWRLCQHHWLAQNSCVSTKYITYHHCIYIQNLQVYQYTLGSLGHTNDDCWDTHFQEDISWNSMKFPKHSDCIISFTGTSSYMWWWSKKNRNSSWSLIHKYQRYKDRQWAVPVLRMFTSWEVESPKWRWLSFSALGKILTLLGVLFLGLHLDHWISYYLYLYFGEISTCWEFF